MANQNKSPLRRLLSTESEWNRKVMIGRVAARVLPDSLLHRAKRSYYAYLMKRGLYVPLVHRCDGRGLLDARSSAARFGLLRRRIG